MPELPEVETIKRGLEKKIIGLKISRVELRDTKLSPKEAKLLEGKIVLNIWRRAKVLGINLASSNSHLVTSSDVASSELTILFHLKMTGQLIYIGNRLQGTGDRIIGGHPTKDMVGPMPNKHTRVIFNFSDGSKLFFNDQRKFGWIKVSDKLKVKEEKFFQGLGPEPLEKDFSWEILKINLLKHKNLPVKVALLDQTVVAGLGNIYVCEALFLAGINPKVKVLSLNDPHFKRLFKGIVEALSQGIEYGGSTRQHFVDIDGARGYFLDKAFVYNRKGLLCRNCQGKIEKIKLSGRGTYLCPNCQKED